MRIERLGYAKLFGLIEAICLIKGHDIHTVPCAPSDSYSGTYCARCLAHWNNANTTQKEPK